MVRPTVCISGTNAPESRSDTIAALEAGAGIFGAVEGKLAVGQPFIRSDLFRDAFFRNRRGHVLCQIHHIIGRRLAISSADHDLSG